MDKNDLFKIKIEDMTDNGEGIGKFNGYTLFVKDTVIGDVIEGKVIKAKKTYGYGKLISILTPSPDRCIPACEAAAPCGGCQLQALNYEAQLKFKYNRVLNHLTRIGGFENVPMQPIIGMTGSVEDTGSHYPFRYRNKAQYPIGRSRDGRIIAGFYAGRTHSIIECGDCLLSDRVNSEILEIIISHMERYNIEPYDEETGKGLVRHVLIRKGFHTGEIMVCIVINGSSFKEINELADRLNKINGMTSVSLNVNREKGNVILGKKIINISGPGYIEDKIKDIRYRISPLSFFQVNPVQTEKLYGKALEYAFLTGNENVWDLYCGIGTISLFLAKQAKHVYGVEIIPAAIENANENAKLNGITNADFFLGKSEEVLPMKYKESYGELSADVIVIDPPRKGCAEELLKVMVEMAPERIVYVSCDSATLARDLKYLCAGGYELKSVQPVDMFPMTVHVETIVLLSHKSPDSVINVTVEFGEGEGKVPLDAIAERAKKYQPKPKITYKMIQEYVEKKYGFKVHTAYIAEVKRSLGLTMYDAPDAVEELKHPRKHPPKEKVEAITEALKYFEVI